jgi:hypothetical protein
MICVRGVIRFTASRIVPVPAERADTRLGAGRHSISEFRVRRSRAALTLCAEPAPLSLNRSAASAPACCAATDLPDQLSHAAGFLCDWISTITAAGAPGRSALPARRRPRKIPAMRCALRLRG